jgi:hypothetical protein
MKTLIFFLSVACLQISKAAPNGSECPEDFGSETQTAQGFDHTPGTGLAIDQNGNQLSERGDVKCPDKNGSVMTDSNTSIRHTTQVRSNAASNVQSADAASSSRFLTTPHSKQLSAQTGKDLGAGGYASKPQDESARPPDSSSSMAGLTAASASVHTFACPQSVATRALSVENQKESAAEMYARLLWEDVGKWFEPKDLRIK